jgi:hypothetical protein
VLDELATMCGEMIGDEFERRFELVDPFVQAA